MTDDLVIETIRELTGYLSVWVLQGRDRTFKVSNDGVLYRTFGCVNDWLRVSVRAAMFEEGITFELGQLRDKEKVLERVTWLAGEMQKRAEEMIIRAQARAAQQAEALRAEYEKSAEP